MSDAKGGDGARANRSWSKPTPIWRKALIAPRGGGRRGRTEGCLAEFALAGFYLNLISCVGRQADENEDAVAFDLAGRSACDVSDARAGDARPGAERVRVAVLRLEVVHDELPKDRPRYLMGVGTPENILECIALGIDMFDCVMPTRNGRNAMLFTTQGVINIDNKKWEFDFSPIDNGLDNEVSNFYSKSYLRHLIKSKEFLGLTIASIHNLAFYLWLVHEARKQILVNNFESWKNEMVVRLKTRL